jgi:hypothetical protein
MLVMSLYSCGEEKLIETPLYPELDAIQLDGIKALRMDSLFIINLPTSSSINIAQVQKAELSFTLPHPDSHISPDAPYNFRDAADNTILFTLSLNKLKKTFYIKVTKAEPPAAVNTPIYGTWIMIWNGSTESWFNPEQYHGATMWVNNTWKATNWNDNAQVDEFILNMKNAGVKLIICDLTNGFRWINKVKYIQEVCAKYDMKVCVAENYGGKFSTFENDAKSIYNNLAGPDAPNRESYFHKDGKPFIVCYCTKSNYDALVNYNSEMRNYFTIGWSSGENSMADKWGWQLEPKVGAVPSDKVMFVSPALKWASGRPELWRKSLAWLDYNFTLVRQNNPEYVIVGSYDDIHERNGWLIVNTINSIPGKQFRDIYGAVSTNAYYNRVKEWMSNDPVSSVPGGLLKDGCYMLKNKKSKLYLQIRNGNGTAGSVLEQSSVALYPLNQYFWFYHLGNNRYRIIPLTTGLSLSPVGASSKEDIAIEQQWDDDVPNQKWNLEKTSTGTFLIQNEKTSHYLSVKSASTQSGSDIIQSQKTEGDHQLWNVEVVVQL